ELSPPEAAERFRALLSDDTARVREAAEHLRAQDPAHASMLWNTFTPTMLRAGERANVVPSVAVATLDVRLLPDEDPDTVLARIRSLVDDPSIEVSFAARDGKPRPPGGTSIDTEAFRAIEEAARKHYGVATLPVMTPAASDAAQARAKGVHCYSVGPAVDA